MKLKVKRQARATQQGTDHNHSQEVNSMFTYAIRHEGMGTFYESFLKITRPAGPLENAAARQYEEWLDKHFSATAIAELPAVQAYAALKAKGADIDAELRRVELERQQSELDQAKLLAGTEGGEKLAVSLTEAQERQQTLAQRLQAARAGVRLFTENMAKAESAARAVILEQFKTTITHRISADHAQADKTARQKIEKVVAPVLDSLVALEHTAFMIGNDHGIDARVDELLTTLPVKPPAGHGETQSK